MGSARQTTIRLRKDLKEPVSFINVTGDIDVSTAAAFRREVMAALQQDTRRIVLRLKHVPYMDSAGVAVLLELIGEAREVNCRVMVLEPSPAAARALGIVDLSDLITIYSSLDECAECMRLTPEAVRSQLTGSSSETSVTKPVEEAEALPASHAG